MESEGSRPGRRTAHEFVRDTLRRGILRGSISGGTRLVQADIAGQLDVSTTPVREALRDLATEGLIQLDAHRGAIVRSLEFSEVNEIYDLRRLLEPEAMRRAAGRLSEETLERSERLQRRMEDEGEIGAWVDLNGQFHDTLMEGVQSSRLRSILEGLRDSVAPSLSFALRDWAAHRQEANREHRELLAAIRDGDGQRAAEVTAQHLEAVIAALETLQAESSGEPEGPAA